MTDDTDQLTEMSLKITNYLGNAFRIHDQFAKIPEKRSRKLEIIPYGVHPALASMLMLTEHIIPLPKRLIYSEALAYHDIIEDTTHLTPSIDPEVVRLVDLLTFKDDEDHVAKAIERGSECVMLKCFDSVCNLFGLDVIKWSRNHISKRLDHTNKLIGKTIENYPGLYIINIGMALIDEIDGRLELDF